MSDIHARVLEFVTPFHETFAKIRSGDLSRKEGRKAIADLLRNTGRDARESNLFAANLVRQFAPPPE